jgi:hypothetical protein
MRLTALTRSCVTRSTAAPDGSFGTDTEAPRPGTAATTNSHWEPPTDGTAYIGLAYALRQYPNSTEFVYLRRLDRYDRRPVGDTQGKRRRR